MHCTVMLKIQNAIVYNVTTVDIHSYIWNHKWQWFCRMTALFLCQGGGLNGFKQPYLKNSPGMSRWSILHLSQAENVHMKATFAGLWVKRPICPCADPPSGSGST